jgi:hypothetical protein
MVMPPEAPVSTRPPKLRTLESAIPAPYQADGQPRRSPSNVSAITLGANALAIRRPYLGATFLLFGGAAASGIALQLATNGTLGFQTDELHYLDYGRHPAFGYVG